MKRSYGALDEFDYVEGLDANQIDRIREIIAPFFWQWFNASQDLKIFTIKILFINYTIRVKHTRNLFELLFGEE